jgi:hypothetical protein
MPGPLLHQGATVLCSHAGQATPTAIVARVTVSGLPVVGQPAPWTVAGCTLPPPTAANGPCVTASWLTAATRVTALGQPLLLVDSQSLCTPTGTPLQPVPGQTRVVAQ